MNLLELHEKHKAVKARERWAYSRAYLTDVYPIYFEPVRSQVTKVLEIGVCWGGSILALRDYFPNAEIVGADIKLDIDFRRAKHSRVTLIQGDQGDPAFLKTLGSLGPYDFIIEDGSHSFTHQALAMEVLPLYLKPGGVLFIEDVVDRHKGWHIEKYARKYKKDGLEVIFHPGLIAVRREYDR
ncbi:MAG: hypothetical protein MN733_07830 [Nitrososphaera sp.]|nr:hypothetical protein [Nitrososphaera sp.]